MATKLVSVSNGLFCGRQQISATLAIKLINEGAAELDPVDGETREQSFRIRMTHKGYEDMAAKPTKRPRIYRSSDTGAALSTMQREELYMGPRETKVVEHVIPVLKRYTRGRFQSWNDRDKFPRHRFNPDSIPAPLRGR